MSTKSTLLAYVILLTATGAMAAAPADDAVRAEQAASASPSAASEAVEAPPEEERKICRTEKATGSLTRRNRICMTAAQWREIYDRTRKGVGEMQGSASGANHCVMNSMGACQGTQTPGASFP